VNRAYAGRWRRWEAWASAHGTPALPADPSALAAWIGELVAGGMIADTVSAQLRSIAAAHRDAGEPDPTADPAVRRAVAQAQARAPTPTLPLSSAQLTQILDRIDTTRLAGRRDAAMLAVGWVGALSAPELVGLDIGDIAWARGGAILGLGDERVAAIPAGGVLDAAGALRAWVRAAGLSGDDPLWPPISRSDRPRWGRISEEVVRRITRRRAGAAGIDGITAGSLRAGRLAEVTDPEAAERLRHHTDIEQVTHRLPPGRLLAATPAP